MIRRLWLTAVLLATIMIGWDSAITSGVSQPFRFDVSLDIAYYNGSDASLLRHTLDIFKPRGLTQAPVLFFVYGGSWEAGDKMYYSYIGRAFAAAGFTTVVVNYRLTPEVQHPGHIEDVARAFAWTYANIERFGGNPNQIFLTGHSAGGHLVSLLALNERFLEAHNLSPALIQGVMPISGVFDLTDPRDGLNFVFTSDLETRRDASPILYVDDEAPPFLVIYGEHDIYALIVQAHDMSSLLEEHGIETSLIETPDKDHLTIIGHMGRDRDVTTQAIIDFVRAHTQGESP